MFKAFIRRLLVIVTAGLCLLPAISHSAHNDPEALAILEELEANRRLVVAENMAVAAEMPAFWELYDAYRLEIGDLEAQGFSLLAEFRDHFENLSDARANDLLLSYFELEQKILAVRKAYVSKFNAVISPKRTLRFYQVENKLDSIIQADISAVTPLISDEPES